MNARRRTRYRTRLQEPEPLEGILERAGEDRFARKRSPIPRAAWIRVVGLRVADRARPVAIEGNELVILTATSVWASELSMLSAELVKRLKDQGFAIERLRFRIGSVDVDRPPERRVRRKVPAPVPVTGELAALLSALEDDDLRSVLGSAASANLAWQDGAELSVSEAPARAVQALPASAAESDRQGQSSPSAPGSGPRSRGGAGRRRS